MLEVPIYASFDSNCQIGVAHIDPSKLPATPDWHLALGYKAKDGRFVGDKYNVTEYEIVCLGLVPDMKFKAYD